MWQGIYWDNRQYYGTSDNPKQKQSPTIKTFGKKYKNYRVLQKYLQKIGGTTNARGLGIVDLVTKTCYPIYVE